MIQLAFLKQLILIRQVHEKGLIFNRMPAVGVIMY